MICWILKFLVIMMLTVIATYKRTLRHSDILPFYFSHFTSFFSVFYNFFFFFVLSKVVDSSNFIITIPPKKLWKWFYYCYCHYCRSMQHIQLYIFVDSYAWTCIYFCIEHKQMPAFYFLHIFLQFFSLLYRYVLSGCMCQLVVAIWHWVYLYAIKHIRDEQTNVRKVRPWD